MLLPVAVCSAPVVTPPNNATRSICTARAIRRCDSRQAGLSRRACAWARAWDRPVRVICGMERRCAAVYRALPGGCLAEEGLDALGQRGEAVSGLDGEHELLAPLCRLGPWAGDDQRGAGGVRPEHPLRGNAGDVALTKD